MCILGLLNHFDIVHVDLWGLAPMDSVNRMKKFLLFGDDHSRYQWLYVLNRKSQVTQLFLHFEAMVARQFGTSIKQLPSDWGPKLICFKGVISEEFLAHTLHFGMELLKEKK